MNLIPLDYSRCSNDKCIKKTICKRFLQMEIDKEKVNFKPPSVCNFDFKNCEKLIRKD